VYRLLLRLAALLSLSSLVLSGALAATDPVVHQVPRAATPIVLDGALDEAAWSAAVSIDLAYEVRPGENIEPPVKTVCLVTYDERHVYFGFRASDPDPSKIRARYSDRDMAWSDDWVGIVLDTFNDQRRAYELFSTPLGVQIDAVNDEVGGNYDDSWNAIWKSAGRITATGYEVEMAIPFNQIRFQPSKGEQVWGFDAIRSYPRDYRHHIGAFSRDRGNNSYLSQAIKLKGMAGASPGRNLEVIPTVTGSRTDSRDTLPDGPIADGDTESDVGVSVRWGITPNISLNGALNPDFSQIEADAVQLDVNEQFALFFRETRPFFMEGADYFNTDLRLVHTRVIADPAAAGKLTGKTGNHTWGVFAAEDELTNVVIPGSESSSSGSFDTKSTNTVGRYRYDFGSSSTIGAMVTDRRGGGYSNSVISADTVYKFTDKDSIRASFAHSETEYSDEMVQAFAGNPGVVPGTISDDAMNLEYNHSERGWWVNANYSDFGDDFRSDLGFRPSVGIRSLWLGGAKVWWGEPGDALQRTAWGAAISRTEFQDGSLQDKNLETWFNTEGPKQSRIYANAIVGDKVFAGQQFDISDFGAGFSMQANASLEFSLDFSMGDWIDFAAVEPAERKYGRVGVRYRAGRHLNLHFAHTISTLDGDDGRIFTFHVPELTVVHQFNTKMFVRLILQYTTIDQEVGEDIETLLSQFLFTYKVNPQTALYVGYTDNQFGNDSFDLTRTDRTFFMKIGYAWLG